MKISSRTGIIITALCCLCMLSYFSLSRKRNKIVEVNDGPNILETMAGRNDSSPFDLVSPLASTSQMFPKVPLHHNIAQIRVRSGSLVDHIEFVMADGNVKTGGYVPPGGNRAPSFGLDPVFVLDPEEHVIRIEMSQGEMLSAIKIFTSKGKETQWYGTKIQKGRLKVFAASAENPIVSFERDSGRVCPRITKVQLLDGTIQEPTNQARPKIARKGGEIPSSLKVSEVRVRAGDLIDLFELAMADGSADNGGFASTGGKPADPFPLAPDEHLVRIEAMQDGALRGVRLHTSKGRESQWYGRQAGERVEFAGSAEDPIVGIERAETGDCPKIAAVTRLRDVAE